MEPGPRMEGGPRERSEPWTNLSRGSQVGYLTDGGRQQLIHFIPLHDAGQHGFGQCALQDGPARVGPNTPRGDDQVEEIHRGGTRGFADGREDVEPATPAHEIEDLLQS